MRMPLAAAALSFTLRGPHGCLAPPTLEELVEERAAQAGLSALPHVGHVVTDGAGDCATPDEQLRVQRFLRHAEACTPARLDVWDDLGDGGGMGRVAALVLPDEASGCAVEAFSDNRLKPRTLPTSIRYQVTLVEDACRGLLFTTAELDWWRLEAASALAPPR